MRTLTPNQSTLATAPNVGVPGVATLSGYSGNATPNPASGAQVGGVVRQFVSTGTGLREILPGPAISTAGSPVTTNNPTTPATPAEPVNTPANPLPAIPVTTAVTTPLSTPATPTSTGITTPLSPNVPPSASPTQPTTTATASDPLGAIFGLIGGLIGGALANSQNPTTPAPASTPSTPTTPTPTAPPTDPIDTPGTPSTPAQSTVTVQPSVTPADNSGYEKMSIYLAVAGIAVMILLSMKGK